MKIIFSLFLLIFSLSSLALTKAEIAQTLEQMKATGMFTDAQIKEAEKELAQMNQSDIDKLVKKGKEHAQDPEFQKKVKQMTNDPKVKAQVEKTVNEMKLKEKNEKK